MLVRCLGANVFFDGAATGAIRVAGVEDMENDIGGINDLDCPLDKACER